MIKRIDDSEVENVTSMEKKYRRCYYLYEEIEFDKGKLIGIADKNDVEELVLLQRELGKSGKNVVMGYSDGGGFSDLVVSE